MKSAWTAICLLFCITLSAQDNPTELAQPIVAEGKAIYRSEMASWFGTDIFLELYKDRENIGGYLSYTSATDATCIFFTAGDSPKVIGTMIFDSTYNVRMAKTYLTERDFTPLEFAYYDIRKKALAVITTDTLFKHYKNTNLNIVPMIQGEVKKVYVLTGTGEQGVVIFGNDYLISFDAAGNISEKKQLHRNIIYTTYGGKADNLKPGQIEMGGAHTHLPETGQYMTATDICTLMLYEKIAQWKQHMVVSEKYLNIWNCETDQLVVIPRETIDKINKDVEKRKKKKKDDE